MRWLPDRETITLTRARAIELNLASSVSGTADQSRRHIVMLLDATVRGQPIRAVGETAPLEPSPAAAEPNRSWRFLTEALSGFNEGLTFSARSARSEVAAITARLRETSQDTPADTRHASRAIISGLEMALLDLVAKVRDEPRAALLGGERRPISLSAGAAIRATQPTSELRRQILAQNRFPMLRFTHVLGLSAALDVATVASEVGGADRPLWLELSEFGVPDARKLVESLADRIQARQLPAHVVLQPPAGTDAATLSELQVLADTLISPDASHPGIVLMADGAAYADEHARGRAGWRGVTVDPLRLGGIQVIHDLAHRMSTGNRNLRLALVTSPHISGITGHAMVELASALPQLDYFFLPLDGISEHPIHVRPHIKLDNADVQLPTDPGIGATVDLSAAVPYVSRLAELPRTVPPAEELVPNTFEWQGAKGINLVNQPLEREVLAAGIDTVRASTEVFVGIHPELTEHIGFVSTRSAWSAVPACDVAKDKAATRTLLDDANVPVPAGATFRPDQVRQAVAFAASVDGSVVVKPRDGRKGKGVSTDLRTKSDVRHAIERLGETDYAGRDFVVEQFVTGDDYRALVIGDRVVSVVMRRPASVVGDGFSNVAELVLKKNYVRLPNPHTKRRPLRLGSDAAFWLDRQDLSTASVPDRGRRVRLSGAANGSSGADTFEVLDEAHPSFLDLAVRACRAIPGLDLAGVDLIGDHTKGVDEHQTAIIEVNDAPGTLLHLFPLYGPPRDVSADLVRRSCELAGYDPGERRDTLSVRIQVHGRVQRVGYRRWFAGRAHRYGLVGSIRNLPSGDVEAHLAGNTAQVSLLAASAIAGPPRARVRSVTTRHVDAVEPTDRFELR